MGPKKQIKSVQEAPKQPETPPLQYTLTGYGRFEYLNGNIYQGNWKIINNQKVKDGYGKITISNFIEAAKSLQSYQGNWAADSMEGFGIYIYANGDIYAGEWRENKHQGIGKMQFANGTFYDGQWKEHKIEGKGLFKDHLGRFWEGQFRNGAFQSRMQMQLSKQKMEQVRKVEIKGQVIEVIKNVITILQNDTDQLINLKIMPFFATKDALKDIIKEAKVGFSLKSKEQWLSILKNCLQSTFYVLQESSQSRTIEAQNLLAKQQSGKGQIVEIQLKEGKPGRLFVVNMEKRRWMIGGYQGNW